MNINNKKSIYAFISFIIILLGAVLSLVIFGEQGKPDF